MIHHYYSYQRIRTIFKKFKGIFYFICINRIFILFKPILIIIIRYNRTNIKNIIKIDIYNKFLITKNSIMYNIYKKNAKTLNWKLQIIEKL